MQTNFWQLITSLLYQQQQQYGDLHCLARRLFYISGGLYRVLESISVNKDNDNNNNN